MQVVKKRRKNQGCHRSAAKSLVLIQGEEKESTCIERGIMADRQGFKKKEADVCEL